MEIFRFLSANLGAARLQTASDILYKETYILSGN